MLPAMTSDVGSLFQLPPYAIVESDCCIHEPRPNEASVSTLSVHGMPVLFIQIDHLNAAVLLGVRILRIL